MAAFFDSGTGSRVELTGDIVLQLLGDGNDSEVEGLDEDEDWPLERPSIPPVSQVQSTSTISAPPQPRRRLAARSQRRTESRRRIWRQVPYNQKEHDFPHRPNPGVIRQPLEYLSDYFDDQFFEKCAMSTNNYHMRKTGRVLNTNANEIKKLVGIHYFMGCIPYPRMHMYWREGLRLDIIANAMARDRFKTLRSALHVVDSDTPPPGNVNSLWKVQPMLDQVKQTCDKLERQPGYYSTDEQMILAYYNKHMGGVDILDQSMEYYRTFMKTKKWTLKVLLHFFDLALCNSWRLYKLECAAAGIPNNKVMDLLEFRMQVSDGLTNRPSRKRRSTESDEEPEPNDPNPTKRFRRSNEPSQAKRYDGYDHLPYFDEILQPRACRMENCKSRSKIKCQKCDVYLCLSRKQNCFADYHKK